MVHCRSPCTWYSLNFMKMRFLDLVSSGKLSFDPAQLSAVEALTALIETYALENTKGIYLYGPVGRGKTMLMDLFFESCPEPKKQRLHFHHFMAKVHRDLNLIQGTPEPLLHIAKQWAERVKVLCFDEFFVSDIGDAMIMANLFKYLFEEGVVLVTTSNLHPSELYKNGLQRARFMPTIDLLQTYCHVISVAGDCDHRFAHGLTFRHYYNDYDAFIDTYLELGGQQSPSQIELHGRPVALAGSHTRGFLFEFNALCSSPRATADYITLANQVDFLFIQNIPQMGLICEDKHTAQGTEEGYIRPKDSQQSALLDDEARRFIALVDEFYEKQKSLVLHSPFELQSLYLGEKLAFAFERTKSRLVEMQHWSLIA